MLKCGVSFAIGAALLVAPSASMAGAWTLPEGSGAAIVTFSGSEANRALNSAVATTVPRYSKYELQGLIEYGVTDRFTFILAPTLQHIGVGAPVNAQRTGFGYTEVGGRYRLMQYDSWVMSAQATARIPGASDATNPANIGYTGFETDLRALVGRSFLIGGMPAFVDLQFAQRFCDGTRPSEFRADFSFGLWTSPRWLLLAQSFNVLSEGSVGPVFPSYEYYKLQLSGVYAITPRIGLQFGGFTTYAGRNVLQENGGIVGIWYRF